MTQIRVSGETRYIGDSQGYIGVSIRDETVNCTVNGPGTPCMTTNWKPTEEELAKLVAGEPVRLRVLGTKFAPLMIDVE